MKVGNKKIHFDADGELATKAWAVDSKMQAQSKREMGISARQPDAAARVVVDEGTGWVSKEGLALHCTVPRKGR